MVYVVKQGTNRGDMGIVGETGVFCFQVISFLLSQIK